MKADDLTNRGINTLYYVSTINVSTFNKTNICNAIKTATDKIPDYKAFFGYVNNAGCWALFGLKYLVITAFFNRAGQMYTVYISSTGTYSLYTYTTTTVN